VDADLVQRGEVPSPGGVWLRKNETSEPMHGCVRLAPGSCLWLGIVAVRHTSSAAGIDAIVGELKCRSDLGPLGNAREAQSGWS
jgi:hypothetical protein